VVTTAEPAAETPAGSAASAALTRARRSRKDADAALSVTTTSTTPAACAGVTAVMVVPLTTITPVAAVPPKVTPVAPVELVPVMVTEVPLRRAAGRRNRRHGRRRHIDIEARPGPGAARRRHRDIVTPAACAGVTAEMVVALTTAMPVAPPPKVTAIVRVKWASVMVTEVPPCVGPLVGATDVTGDAT